MFIRLFIKSIDKDKTTESINNILSYLDEHNIMNKKINTERYWKYDDITVAEINLELNKNINCEERKFFLKYISNKWDSYGENEALSSSAMNECKLNFNLEMVNIFFE